MKRGLDAGRFVGGVPVEYVEFLVCEMFGWTPQTYAQVPARFTDRALRFASIRAEIEAEQVRRAQRR